MSITTLSSLRAVYLQHIESSAAVSAEEHQNQYSYILHVHVWMLPVPPAAPWWPAPSAPPWWICSQSLAMEGWGAGTSDRSSGSPGSRFSGNGPRWCREDTVCSRDRAAPSLCLKTTRRRVERQTARRKRDVIVVIYVRVFNCSLKSWSVKPLIILSSLCCKMCVQCVLTQLRIKKHDLTANTQNIRFTQHIIIKFCILYILFLSICL